MLLIMGHLEELGGSERPLRYFAKQNSFLSQIFASSEKFPALQRVGCLTLRGEFYEGKNFA